jgi:hypothetical protein
MRPTRGFGLSDFHRAMVPIEQKEPLHRRQMVRPKRFDAHRASFRAIAAAVSGFHGFAFLRGGMMAAAPRAAIAS